MIDLARTNDPQVLGLLRQHPRVIAIEPGDVTLEFWLGSWRREVRVGDPAVELRGLIELMDNNPLVCADSVSVPSAGATLALIALGPLAAAGLILEPPALLTNASLNEDEVNQLLIDLGWSGGVVAQTEESDLGGAYAATAMAMIRTPDDLEEIDELYEERFGRSFFVRRDEESEWDVNLVLRTPLALYRLRITPDQPNSLLTIQTMADANGKCGAAQVVHAMNVMCGFEESLGLATA